jgi:hypothetical protein
MESFETKLSTLRLLLSRSLDGTASPEDMAQLNRLLLEDSQIRRYYLEYIQIHINLRRLHGKDASALKTGPEESFDSRLWEELAHNEKTAETIEIEPSRDEVGSQTETSLPVRPSARINKFSIYTMLTAAAALLLTFTYIYFNPIAQPVVASIGDTMNGQWDTLTPVQAGDDIRSQRYNLQHGFIKLTYDSGANVVIEAPAEFTPLSTTKLLLHKGQAFAHVPTHAIGFTIDTPGSSIVDLGTEFGVYAGEQNSSEVHVVQGKVNLIAGLSGITRQSEIVQQAQAKLVDAVNGRVRSIPFEKYRFVRRIDSKSNIVWKGRDVISLNDLVAGGNGYGTSTEISVSYAVATGEKTPSGGYEYRAGAGSYQKVSSNPFIDGVFVPQSKNQVVSSEGHVFADCPETSGLYFMDLCFNKKWKYNTLAAQRYEKMRDLTFEPCILYMHSNLGATFNLDAVRRQFPGLSIRRFLTTVGTLSSYGGYPIYLNEDFSPAETEFDVWFVVDGQLRMKAQKVHSDSLINLEVPLSPEDQFLSILVTDGSVGSSSGNTTNQFDMCGLADSRFEMESLE